MNLVHMHTHTHIHANTHAHTSTHSHAHIHTCTHINICIYTLTYAHTQGILFSTPECLKTPVDFVRLWLHEATRVYGDKLIDVKDMENFKKMKYEIAKAAFEVRGIVARVWLYPNLLVKMDSSLNTKLQSSCKPSGCTYSKMIWDWQPFSTY